MKPRSASGHTLAAETGRAEQIEVV